MLALDPEGTRLRYGSVDYYAAVCRDDSSGGVILCVDGTGTRSVFAGEEVLEGFVGGGVGGGEF